MLQYITWAVSPEIFSIGPLTLRWYGLLFATGFLVGQQLMFKIYKTEGLPEKNVETLTVWMVLATIVGARLGHCLFYEPDYYLSHPLEILKIWEGGLASHGATVGILGSIWFYSKKHPQEPYLWILDRLVITIAFAGGCIRLGNLMNSEIIGKPTELPWAFIFVSEDLIPRHPAQLYEAISCFVLFIILWSVYKKYKSALPHGILLGYFMMWIFGLRFVYEFLKENQVAFEDNLALNMGQLLSIPLVAAGAWLVWRAKRAGAPAVQS